MFIFFSKVLTSIIFHLSHQLVRLIKKVRIKTLLFLLCKVLLLGHFSLLKKVQSGLHPEILLLKESILVIINPFRAYGLVKSFINEVSGSSHWRKQRGYRICILWMQSFTFNRIFIKIGDIHIVILMNFWLRGRLTLLFIDHCNVWVVKLLPSLFCFFLYCVNIL